MPITYKIDVLQVLKEKGFSSYKLRQRKIMGERTIQQLRTGELVSWETIARICALLDCQPGDIVEYTPENEEGDRQ